jgi:glucose uptake protein
LLILSFLVLGLWSSTFKLAGNRWRFELFSFDFAFGILAFAVVSSYTLGSFGSDLGFTDHLLISSRTNQAMAFGAGCLFAFGNMLLLSATALLGLSFAYAIATAAAVLALAAVEFNGTRALFLGLAIGAALLTIVFQAMGASRGEETLPAVALPVIVRKSSSRQPRGKSDSGGMPNSSKGIIVAVLSGLAFGVSFSPLHKSIFQDFGLGAFAGVVVFSAGVLAATIVLNFYFMNIAVHGGSIGMKYYLRGTVGQHLLGIIGGILCGAGILSLLLLPGFPAEVQPDKLWLAAVPLAAGLLAIALGVSKWREQAEAPGSVTRSLLIGALFLVAAIGAFALAMDKTLPPPPPTSGLVHLQLLG